MWCVQCYVGVALFSQVWVTSNAMELAKSNVDNIIEDEITKKLGEDLLQSIEKKFQVDLEKSVDTVLGKIKILLQNGTTHIQDGLVELQGMLDVVKNQGEKEFEDCLLQRQNDTAALAEKALHQMVVCGYALIGHDPAQAVSKVIMLKNMISEGVKPIYEQKTEVYGLLKVCGHDHETLKKVIKCVISKSPLLKSTMMEITGKLIEGVVELTKLMAHGAMHEACLIEVIKTTEDEAIALVKEIKYCSYGNNTLSELNSYIEENNATVIDVTPNNIVDKEDAMKGLIRKMLKDNKGKELDEKFNKQLKKLQNDLGPIDKAIEEGDNRVEISDK